MRIVPEVISDKVFKNGPGKICGKQPLKSLKEYCLRRSEDCKKKLSENSLKVVHTLNLLEHGLYKTIAWNQAGIHNCHINYITSSLVHELFNPWDCVLRNPWASQGYITFHKSENNWNKTKMWTLNWNKKTPKFLYQKAHVEHIWYISKSFFWKNQKMFSEFVDLFRGGSKKKCQNIFRSIIEMPSK